ncbi:ABC transporter ATP-binding protein [Chitinophaga agrisoli]|uniref:ABC transporter ATP-binding protein n=1 Tax=Chitinophaga agrisoli TaxID=2607653 RepID=A0A5B2VLF4_9BACT|nr:ABC transporter ATP-binding protein [Chitinophaga agrisoli]KAA2239029.1 ABC transporter ATP-binding protein [Chitinophaga agrisoli]
MKYLVSAILRILDQQEKVRLCKLIAWAFVISVLDILFLGGLLLVINFYTKKAAPDYPLLLRLFTDNNPLLLLLVFFLLFSVKNWLGYRISAWQHTFFHQVASRLSRRNLWNYMRDDYTHFIHTDSSVLIRKISQQPIEFSTYILTNVQQVVSQLMLIACTITAILFYHPVLFLLLFALLLLPVVLLGGLIRKQLRQVRASNKRTSEKTIQYLQESLSGFIESNIYNKHPFFIDRYATYQQRLNHNIGIQHSLQELPARLIEVFAILGFLILVAIHQWMVNTPYIDLLSIGVFVAGAYKIIPGIVKILNSTGQIKTYAFVLDDLLPAFHMSQAAHQHIDTSAHEHIRSLRFDNVSFRYDRHRILHNCSFTLAPGDFAGISGRSGRGKTTLIHLILGFLEQQQGAICINDAITGAAARQQYWPRISYVKQQPFFINDSVLRNVVLTDGAYDLHRLQTALSLCGIDKMLHQYPEGLDKQITENGKNISGGQRQRIALARALYHDFDLLILDEPFSEMDEAAESVILTQLAHLAQEGKMILFITHNKASLAYCNKTILLDNEQYA